ncbi:choloylglycine hydrolase family protein [Bradyrhizobium sp. NP1]|jgi:choloylglycine hydrolase|uniref:choloylglycine hydrolase family protein n=1 Tax=Bradyrhizobium sp. NP1 TaxID=3049772 RepID=UPI0025A50B3F|nr:choloylglycine hydrolase family protein [Bradyrhizobium sp. NP1]WJR79203.1 choloylglycine hydrolase family protein [Bradyrhizobium sp. NP1]
MRHLAIALLITSLITAPTAQACTAFRLVAKDGGVVYGRTMEFGFDVKSDVVVVPAGTEISGSLPTGGKGITYKTKYGMVGATVVGLPVIVDGINDQGLAVGLLYFPGYASYPEAMPENKSRAMAPHELGNWILGNFATVDEVKTALKDVVLVPVMVEAIKQPAPVHFIVYDRSGKSIVIEPLDKTLKSFDNPLGVLTNSPNFEWHTTNLRNYLNLMAKNAPAVDLKGMKLTQFGQGSGMLGLPGDATPPSRFVRAVAYSQSAIPAETNKDAVLKAFHILNAFDIPVGVVREEHEGELHTDYTVWSSVADLKDLTWSFKTYNDQSIRTIDLRQALDAAKGQVRHIAMDSKQPIENISTRFK